MPARPFALRPAPLRPLRRAVRSWRSRPHRGLSGPLLLALALAGTGQYVSSQAKPAGASVLTVAAEAPGLSSIELRDAGTLASLRASRRIVKPVAKPAPRPVVRKSAPVRRTPQRATRSAPRVAAPRATGRWARPCSGAMTSGYGPRWGRMHRGIDVCGNYGITVVAAGDGVVILAGSGMSGYGNQVQIRHANGVVSTYSHLSAFLVRGGRVTAGQPIGRTGSTGNVTGPHLHFEVKVGGANVDPQSFLRRNGVHI